jgi:predicted ester cyclase
MITLEDRVNAANKLLMNSAEASKYYTDGTTFQCDSPLFNKMKTFNEFTKSIDQFKACVPDFNLQLRKSVAQNTTVVLNVRGTGTHTGAAFGPIEPTGKSAEWRSTYIFEFRNNELIVDAVEKTWDEFHVFQEFGWIQTQAKS